jgi:hypothetical protein
MSYLVPFARRPLLIVRNSLRRAPCLVIGAIAPIAIAQPTIDGTRDVPYYGAPAGSQLVETQFGDSGLGLIDFANGSELDAAYGFIDGGSLFMFFSGNLESNFNKLEVFLDTRTGGQNRLRGDNPNVSFDGLNRMGDDGSSNGLTFPPEFEADHWISITGGDTGGGVYGLFVDFAQLREAADPGVGYFVGAGGAGTSGSLSGGSNPYGIRCTINNGNIAGVAGGTACGSGAGSVLTGVEIEIPLAAFGMTADDVSAIAACAFVNGSGHDFVSNQVLPSLACPQGNLGDPRNVNLSDVMEAPNTATVQMPKKAAGPWYEKWRAATPGNPNPNDQGSIDTDPATPGIQPAHSGLSVWPGGGRISDEDLKNMAAPLAGCTEFVWAMGQCFSGGFIDDLNANAGTQSITTACRHKEKAYYEILPPAGNGKDWVFAYLDGIGAGNRTALAIATDAAANDPWGPNPAPVPARVAAGEVAGREHPQYFATAAAADGLKLTKMVGANQVGRGVAILYAGRPESNPANANSRDRKAIADAVVKLKAIGFKGKQIYVFYGPGKVGAAHPLNAHIGGADSITLRRANANNVGGLFNTLAIGRKPEFVFWLSADHGWNDSVAAGADVAPGGGGGGGVPDPDSNPNDPYGDGDSDQFPTPMNSYFPAPCESCLADVNLSGVVDLSDLTALLSAFGSCYGDPSYTIETDLNGDGCVDLGDLTLLLSAFGFTCA